MRERAVLLAAAQQCFSPDLLDQEAVTRWFLERLYPAGPICPGCKTPLPSEKLIQSFWALRRVRCRGCNFHGTAATGTFLNGLKFDIRVLYMLALMLSVEAKRPLIADILKLSPQTVRTWEVKLKAFGVQAVELPPLDELDAALDRELQTLLAAADLKQFPEVPVWS